MMGIDCKIPYMSYVSEILPAKIFGEGGCTVLLFLKASKCENSSKKWVSKTFLSKGRYPGINSIISNYTNSKRQHMALHFFLELNIFIYTHIYIVSL